MGEFDASTGTFVPGSRGDDPYVGVQAGVRGRGPEPMPRRDLHERAKQMVPPSLPRDDAPPPAPFDGWGSKAERRTLTRAAEVVAGMDADTAEQYREWIADARAELDATVGPAESGRAEQDEKLR